jgi:hypothetical protein
MIWQILTAIAAVISTAIFAGALWYARIQVKEIKQNRKLQEVVAIFKELKTPELVAARRYIYESFPEDLEGIELGQLKTHLQKAEVAFIVFDRLGYLIEQGHVDKEPILDNYWPLIWRCWKKSEKLIHWTREQRGQKESLRKFEYLFNLAEVYRIQHGYPRPKFF